LENIIKLHNDLGTDKLFIRSMIDRNGNIEEISQDTSKLLMEIDKQENIVVRQETFARNTKGCEWTKCYGINFRSNLDHNGELHSCSRRLAMPSNFGNIYKNRFNTIWSSIQKKELFNAIESGSYINVCGKFCDVSADNIFIEDFLRNKEHNG